MAATLRALDQVIGLKGRRIARLEAQAVVESQQVKACEAQVDEARAEADAARERQREAESIEQAAADAVVALSARPGGFLPGDLVTLHHVREMKAADVKEAVKFVQRAEKLVQAAEQRAEAARETLRQTRRAIERSQQQLEELGRLRDRLAAEAFQAAEDVQDEEAEEASVARLIASAREAAFDTAERCR